MDSLLSQIVDFVHGDVPANLDNDALDAVKRRLLDTVACHLGGYDSAPAVAARQAALTPTTEGARIWGSGAQVAVEEAAFANAVAVRYLDFNDTLDGHPSDNIPVLVACAQTVGASGMKVLESIAISYDVHARLYGAYPFMPQALDQGTAASIGAAAGCAHLLGLDRVQTRHAVSIAAASSLALMATRSGQLSWWKAAAVPFAARNGFTAARLAAAGFTGPESPFAGKGGLLEVLGQEPVDLRLGATPLGVRASNIKWWPVRDSCQFVIDAAIDVGGIPSIDDVESIQVFTYGEVLKRSASDDAHWLPQTRETADHSLPFAVAIGLVDRTVTPETFVRERYLDADIVRAIGAMTAEARSDYDALYPAERHCEVVVTMRDGSERRGHSAQKVGVTDADVELKRVLDKYESLSPHAISDAEARAQLQQICLNFEHEANVERFVGALAFDAETPR